ncbi:MAG: DMT family transporter [Holosporaceae bacterium]|nr:DMT family transporter [Holosporaceae bacterium]
MADNFFRRKGYGYGIFFLFLMMLVSCANDVIAKFIGQRIDPVEVIFFRFFFSLVTLLPFVWTRGLAAILKTSYPLGNILRGMLGAASFYLYTYALVKIQIVEVVSILWTIPLFVLVLSIFFLNERVDLHRWVATLIGFFGLSFITLYDSGVSFSLKMIYLIPVASAFLFAVQDIMIKKMVSNDDAVTMLLYFAFVSSVITIFPALMVWKTPMLNELLLLFLYGLFANLMQYLIFLAFEATDLSALAPFRYVEFLLSAVTAFLFFGEIPGVNVLVGALILIPCTLYLTYGENKRARKYSNKKNSTPKEQIT